MTDVFLLTIDSLRRDHFTKSLSGVVHTTASDLSEDDSKRLEEQLEHLGYR